MATQSKFSQIYLRLNAYQRKAFAAWLPSQPGSEHTLALLKAWHADPEIFVAQAQQLTDADGGVSFSRRLHYLKDALENFLIWETLARKEWLQKALLAEAYSDLALPEFVQETLSGKKMEEMEQSDVKERLEIFARYMVSNWQIHNTIVMGKHPNIHQINLIHDNFYKILISSILDIKSTISGIIRNTPEPEILPDQGRLQALQELIPSHLYATSPNLTRYLQIYILSNQIVPPYSSLNEFYIDWMNINQSDNIINNTYAIAFYRGLRNGFTRYCNAHPADSTALEQLWTLWEEGLRKGYALVAGYLPENEWRILMKVAKKRNTSKDDLARLLKSLEHVVPRKVARKMAEIYTLWYDENFADLIQITLISPASDALDEAYWWEATLLGIRATFVSKEFYKRKVISAKVVNTLAKIRKELKDADVRDQHNPRTHAFLIECGVAKACTKARKKADWEHLLDEIDRTNNFPGKAWYRNFAIEMAQGLR